MKTNLLIILTVFFLSVSNFLAQTPEKELILEKGVVPHAKIDDVYRRFSEAYKKLDAEAVTNLYTDEALYLAPGSNVERGREKILTTFSSFFNSVKTSGGSLTISFRILERRVSGDLAYDVGIFTLTRKSAKGEERIGRGKFVVVVRRMKNDEWRFQVDAYNDLPAAQSNQAAAIDCTVYSAQKASLYILPFEVGKSFEVWRTVEHYARGNGGVGLYSIDFAMPIGTSIIAAREGEVVAARGEFYDNNGEDLKENFVFIRHADGSIGRYFHLTRDGALVKIGDKIKQGQLIGLSGNTGQSAGPHLHFDVQQCGPNLPPNYNQMPCGQTVPVIFRNTEEYACNLVSGKTYKALNFVPNNQLSMLETDKAAIEQTALDYIEGWYSGDAERMERALHPDLAKRIVRTNSQGQSRLDQMSALMLVQGVKRGGGKQTPMLKQQKDVIILDVFENTASVKAVMSDWIDYMHMAKYNGRWVIVNVLWELKPKEK